MATVRMGTARKVAEDRGAAGIKGVELKGINVKVNDEGVMLHLDLGALIAPPIKDEV